jgi:hypothetical protein
MTNEAVVTYDEILCGSTSDTENRLVCTVCTFCILCSKSRDVSFGLFPVQDSGIDFVLLMYILLISAAFILRFFCY